MAEQEITYTEKVEKTESVTVCDGCGLEVVPGENCRTVVGNDDDDYGEDVQPKLAHDLGDHLAFKFAEKNCVELNGLVYVPSHKLFEQLDSTYHYCFDCWSEVNLTLDDESADMVAQYESTVREDVMMELYDEWRSKTFVSRFRTANVIDVSFLLGFFVAFAAAIVLDMPNMIAMFPLLFFALVMVSILGRPD